MEQTPLPPLLSDEILAHLNCRCENCVRRVSEVIEADRAKTREVVQALVNDMQDFVDKVDRGEAMSKRSYAAFKHRIEVAKSQLNIEPTKP